MPYFRGPKAELRRVHRDATWVVAGVWVEGHFWPAMSSINVADARLIQARLVRLNTLPDIVATDERHAAAIATQLAADLAPLPSIVPRDLILRGDDRTRIEAPRN